MHTSRGLRRRRPAFTFKFANASCVETWVTSIRQIHKEGSGKPSITSGSNNFRRRHSTIAYKESFFFISVEGLSRHQRHFHLFVCMEATDSWIKTFASSETVGPPSLLVGIEVCSNVSIKQTCCISFLPWEFRKQTMSQCPISTLFRALPGRKKHQWFKQSSQYSIEMPKMPKQTEGKYPGIWSTTKSTVNGRLALSSASQNCCMFWHHNAF